MGWQRGTRIQAALTGCVTVAAVIASAVGGGSGATPLAAGKVIALMRNAPLALSAYPSLTMRMSVNVSANGRSVNLVVNGVTSSDGHSGIVTEQLPGGLGTVHLTVANHAFYGQVAPSHYAETGGKQWAELKLTTSSPAQASPSSATAYVQLLAGVGSVKDKGSATIDGTKVEHYHVDVDVAKAVAQVPPELRTTSAAQLQALGVTSMPMDVWITDAGLPVQMKFSINAQGASAHVTLKLRGSNRHVTIVIPPANQTYEVTNIAELGHLIAP
jgi:hypothetical protein